MEYYSVEANMAACGSLYRNQGSVKFTNTPMSVSELKTEYTDTVPYCTELNCTVLMLSVIGCSHCRVTDSWIWSYACQGNSLRTPGPTKWHKERVEIENGERRSIQREREHGWTGLVESAVTWLISFSDIQTPHTHTQTHTHRHTESRLQSACNSIINI